MVRTVDLRFILMQSSNRLKIRMLQSHHLISNIPGNTTSCWRIWPRVKNHKQCNFISCTPLISRDLKNIPGFNYDLLCERHTTTGYVLKRLTMHLSISIAVSGVFKGRRARHLPRAPPFWRPPWGVTRIHFPYFWWKFYHPLIPKQITSKYFTFKASPTETVMSRYFAFKRAPNSNWNVYVLRF